MKKKTPLQKNFLNEKYEIVRETIFVYYIINFQ